MAKKKLSESIYNVKRIPNRRMCMTFKTSAEIKIKIINTYAPHMGYKLGERAKYWEEIIGVMKQLNKNDCVIWCTDNNGEIGRTRK